MQLLLRLETGFAPRKVGVGPNRSELTYERGDPGSGPTPTLRVGGQKHGLSEFEDIYWQASTRGGRPVERILAGKVQFKENIEGTGEALGALGTRGLAYSQTIKNRNKRRQAELASAGVMLLGALAGGIGNSVKPEADLRSWRNLPDRLYLHSLASDQPAEVSGAGDSATCASPAESGTRLLWLRTPQHRSSGP
jgi:hypothetical protein